MINKKTIITTLGVILTIALITAFKQDNKLQSHQKKTVKGDSFAVVELFTSEGCSSCPPADQLLGNIMEKARANGKRVFALAFHVDYWNNLGWKDIYSSSAYSHRQRNYARALGSSVYTPQMIINGRNQFVGSNRSKARNTINKTLNKAAPVAVTLNSVDATAHRVNLNYIVEGDYTGSVLNLAIVERGVVRHIKRGENTGLTMHHQNVVRTFNSMKLERAKGTASLKLPKDVHMDNASVIAYVQNPASKEIVGAASKDL